MRNTHAKVLGSEGLVPVASRQLLGLLIFCLPIAVPAHAKNHETGFLDRTITVQGATYKYQVFVPDTWTPRQKWPVILFLHGAGERGEDGLQQTDVGIGTAIRSNRSAIPAIVVMPQCRTGVWWMQPPMDELAIAALNAATKEFHGDVRRTYLTGLSMGGYGSWYLAGKYAGRFAALVVICGGIRPPAGALKNDPELVKWTPADDPKSYAEAAAKVGNTPVWIFHGADDDIVPATESQRMYTAMKAIGADVHYTEFPGIGHAVWDKAYDEPTLFPWLFSKSLAVSEK
jgi:predicted peptidase